MWNTIRNTLLRWLLGILDPNFKAELDAFEQIKATKQRELEALQDEISGINQQITEAQSRQMEALNDLAGHLGQVENIEALIQKVKNEKQVDISSIPDDTALHNKL